MDTEGLEYARTGVRLPEKPTSVIGAAEVAISLLSRSQLTKAIETCERYSKEALISDDDIWRAVSDDWKVIAKTFRVERRRRYQ